MLFLRVRKFWHVSILHEKNIWDGEDNDLVMHEIYNLPYKDDLIWKVSIFLW